jgi:hypothetical protein
MFKKSDYFILAAVMLSFLVSAFQWFVQQDIDQAIFTAIWVPSILGLGMYFKLTALLGRSA